MRCHFVQSFLLSLPCFAILFVSRGNLDVSPRADWREYDICVAFVNTRRIGLLSILAAAVVHQSQCQEVKYGKNEDYQ